MPILASQRAEENFQVGASDNHGDGAMKQRESLAKLRLSLKGEPELNARSDADFLLRYLRFTNSDEVRAHKIIKSYYKHRARYPKIFDQLTPTNVAEDFSRHLVSVLPERDNHGQPVLLVRIGAWPSDLAQINFNRLVALTLEHVAMDAASQKSGVSILLDFDSWSIAKMMTLDIGLVKQAAQMIQELLPFRVNQAHVVRQPNAFSIFFSLMKPFLGKAEQDRFLFHGTNFEALHTHIPKSSLPKEYGGDGPCINYDGYFERIKRQEQEFIDIACYGYTRKS
ncbi:alpha-tocopherol transfer protein-like [Ixodes scapularis]|uniref:alpha-tocopherol transfer protein-like n=1 Tax=Ixodes scapularis TaxID=6945 RepID=UPI001C39362D|nr:alpha-tocopherol transfer protein-like [Ixodes scapularis]